MENGHDPRAYPKEVHSSDLPEAIYNLPSSLPEVASSQSVGKEYNDANLISMAREKEVAVDTQKELVGGSNSGRGFRWRCIALITVILIIAVVGGTVGGILGYRSTFVKTAHG